MRAMNSTSTSTMPTIKHVPGPPGSELAGQTHLLRLSARPLAALAGIVALGMLPQAAHACATCGCTLSTDAATGYSTESGWRINVDYTYIDQDQLRSGGSRATPEQVVNQPSDPSLGDS